MKSEVDKLDIKNLVNIPSSLNNLKIKGDDLDVGKLKTVPIDLKKLTDVVDNEIVRNMKFNTLKIKVHNLEKKVPDAATLIHINQYNTDKQNVEKKIGDVYKKTSDTSGVVTTTVLNTKGSEYANKIPDTSSLMTTIVLNTKISEVENKIFDHAKYITNPEFNKLTAENFVARLKQANLVTETDFDNKLKSFYKRITSNKKKHLEVQTELNSLITKYYNFFLGRIYFKSNDESQNTFVCQPILDILELKKTNVLIMFLAGNQREYTILNLSHYLQVSYIV